MCRKVRLSQEGVEYRIADWKRNTSPFSDSEGRKRPHFWPLLPNQYRLHAKKELTKQAFQAKYSLTLRPMTPYVAIPLVGNGKRLFHGESQQKEFKLVHSHTFGSGVVVLTYEPHRK